jgi:hypothetical protein
MATGEKVARPIPPVFQRQFPEKHLLGMRIPLGILFLCQLPAAIWPHATTIPPQATGYRLAVPVSCRSAETGTPATTVHNAYPIPPLAGSRQQQSMHTKARTLLVSTEMAEFNRPVHWCTDKSKLKTVLLH